MLHDTFSKGKVVWLVKSVAEEEKLRVVPATLAHCVWSAATFCCCSECGAYLLGHLRTVEASQTSMETKDDRERNVEEVISPKLCLLIFLQLAQVESYKKLLLGSMWERKRSVCSKPFSSGLCMQKFLKESLWDSGTNGRLAGCAPILTENKHVRNLTQTFERKYS